VAQAYEAPVYMDFDKQIMQNNGYGYYETFPGDLLPNLYIAFRAELSEGSEVVHNDLRQRYDAGEKVVKDAMERFAELTSSAYELLKNGGWEEMGELMNENFDLRRSISHIHEKNLEMVELARSVGASAKFTGSGGAIIGTYRDHHMYEELSAKFESFRIKILKPEIIDHSEN
jgi:glucuronokinase